MTADTAAIAKVPIYHSSTSVLMSDSKAVDNQSGPTLPAGRRPTGIYDRPICKTILDVGTFSLTRQKNNHETKVGDLATHKIS